MTKRPTAKSRPLTNDALAATADESEVLSLVVPGSFEPGLFDPGLFVPVSFFRVLLMAIPLTEFLVVLLGKEAFVEVST